MKLTIGTDLAKTVLKVHGADDKGKMVLKKQLKRNQVLPFFANLTPYRQEEDALRRFPPSTERADNSCATDIIGLDS